MALARELGVLDRPGVGCRGAGAGRRRHPDAGCTPRRTSPRSGPPRATRPSQGWGLGTADNPVFAGMHEASALVAGATVRGRRGGVARRVATGGQRGRRPAPRDAGPGVRLLRLQRPGGRDRPAARPGRRSGWPMWTSTCTTATACRRSSGTTRGCSRSACTRRRWRCSPAPGSRTRPAGRARRAARSTWRCRRAPTTPAGCAPSTRSCRRRCARSGRRSCSASAAPTPTGSTRWPTCGCPSTGSAPRTWPCATWPTSCATAAGSPPAAAGTRCSRRCRGRGPTCSRSPPGSRSTRRPRPRRPGGSWPGNACSAGATAAGPGSGCCPAGPASRRRMTDGASTVYRPWQPGERRRGRPGDPGHPAGGLPAARPRPARPAGLTPCARPTCCSRTARPSTCDRSRPTTPTGWSRCTPGSPTGPATCATSRRTRGSRRATWSGSSTSTTTTGRRWSPRSATTSSRSAGTSGWARARPTPRSRSWSRTRTRAGASARPCSSTWPRRPASPASPGSWPRCCRRTGPCCGSSATPGSRCSREYADGVVHLTFPIAPTERSLEVQRRREQQAEARSIARLLAPASIAVYGARRDGTGLGATLLRHAVEGGFTGPIYPIHAEASTVEGLPAYATRGRRARPGRRGPGRGTGGPDPVRGGRRRPGRGARAGGRLGRLRRGGRGRRRGAAAFVGRRPRVRDAGRRAERPRPGQHRPRRPAARHHRAGPAAGAGRIGVFCQSAAVGIAVLGEAYERGLGLSTFVSAGNRADVSGNDLLQFWRDDPRTDVVLLYLETFGNPHKFTRIARELGRDKPVVAVDGRLGRIAGRAGRAGAGRAVRPVRRDPGGHSGRAVRRRRGAGHPAAAGRRPGRAWSATRRPGHPGPRGGAAGRARGTRAGSRVVPTGADPDDLETAVHATLDDDAVDAVLVVIAPPLPGVDVVYESAAAAAATGADKPVVAVFVGSTWSAAGPLREAGVPTFGTVEEAVAGAGPGRPVRRVAPASRPASLPDLSDVDAVGRPLGDRPARPVRGPAARLRDRDRDHRARSAPSARRSPAAREIGYPVAVKTAFTGLRAPHRPRRGPARRGRRARRPGRVRGDLRAVRPGGAGAADGAARGGLRDRGGRRSGVRAGGRVRPGRAGHRTAGRPGLAGRAADRRGRGRPGPRTARGRPAARLPRRRRRSTSPRWSTCCCAWASWSTSTRRSSGCSSTRCWPTPTACPCCTRTSPTATPSRVPTPAPAAC